MARTKTAAPHGAPARTFATQAPAKKAPTTAATAFQGFPADPETVGVAF